MSEDFFAPKDSDKDSNKYSDMDKNKDKNKNGNKPQPSVSPSGNPYKIPDVLRSSSLDVTPSMLFKELADNPDIHKAYNKCVVILLDDVSKTPGGVRYGAEIRVAGMDSPQIIAALEYSKMVILRDMLDEDNYYDDDYYEV